MFNKSFSNQRKKIYSKPKLNTARQQRLQASIPKFYNYRKKEQSSQSHYFMRPKRDVKWADTSKFGIPIRLTDKVYIVAFKCPMKKEFNPYYQPYERLSCSDVKAHYKDQHKMKLISVFDLTNTNKYYDRKDWGQNINYFKYRS